MAQVTTQIVQHEPELTGITLELSKDEAVALYKVVEGPGHMQAATRQENGPIYDVIEALDTAFAEAGVSP